MHLSDEFSFFLQTDFSVRNLLRREVHVSGVGLSGPALHLRLRDVPQPGVVPKTVVLAQSERTTHHERRALPSAVSDKAGEECRALLADVSLLSRLPPVHPVCGSDNCAPRAPGVGIFRRLLDLVPDLSLVSGTGFQNAVQMLHAFLAGIRRFGRGNRYRHMPDKG